MDVVHGLLTWNSMGNRIINFNINTVKTKGEKDLKLIKKMFKQHKETFIEMWMDNELLSGDTYIIEIKIQ